MAVAHIRGTRGDVVESVIKKSFNEVPEERKGTKKVDGVILNLFFWLKR